MEVGIDVRRQSAKCFFPARICFRLKTNLCKPREPKHVKANIIGGGPAGLYFALLAKKQHPEDKITVFGTQAGDGNITAFFENALVNLERKKIKQF